MEYKNLMSLNIINEVLYSFNEPEFFINSSIKVIKETLSDEYVQFKLVKHDKHVPLYFELFNDSIRIDIGDTEETFEYIGEEIINYPKNVTEDIRKILSSYIMIQRIYGGRFDIRMFNSEGINIKSKKYTYFNKIKLLDKSEMKLYLPVFYQ